MIEIQLVVARSYVYTLLASERSNAGVLQVPVGLAT